MRSLGMHHITSLFPSPPPLSPRTDRNWADCVAGGGYRYVTHCDDSEDDYMILKKLV